LKGLNIPNKNINYNIIANYYLYYDLSDPMSW